MIEAGSRYENKDNNGISHFLEHMMFKGTKKRPSKKDISVQLDGIGASFNAFTSKEYTGFYVKASAEHEEFVLEILSDIVLNSVYSDAEMDKDRGVIIEEINGDEDEPASKVFQEFEKILFQGSPLAMTVAGEKKNIEEISREMMVDYVNKMYHSGSMIVAMAGSLGEPRSNLKSQNSNVGLERQKSSHELVEKFFGNVAKGGENKFEKAVSKQQTAQSKVLFKETEQAHLCLGFPGYSLINPDRYALSVLSNILGGTMSSRLFEEVREKRGLAYYVSSYAEEYQDTGFVMANAGVRLDSAEEVIKVILSEFAKIRESGVSEQELRRAKDYSKGKMVLSLEDSFRVASFFAGQEILEKKVLLPDEILAKLDAVTNDDIVRVAKDLFKSEKLNLSLIGPFKNEEKFTRLLKI
jgi:predicted Zn-dependent peptidase